MIDFATVRISARVGKMDIKGQTFFFNDIGEGDSVKSDPQGRLNFVDDVSMVNGNRLSREISGLMEQLIVNIFIFKTDAALDRFHFVVLEFNLKVAVIGLQIFSASQFISIQSLIVMLMIKEIIVRVVIQIFVPEKPLAVDFQDLIMWA